MSSQHTIRLADRIQQASQSRRFPSMSVPSVASVSEYYGKFQELCTPTQLSVILVILHICLRAYLNYTNMSEGYSFSIVEEVKAVALIVAVMAGSNYFCTNGQIDYAWGVVVVYVLAVAYGYVTDAVYDEAKTVYAKVVKGKGKAAAGGAAAGAAAGLGLQAPIQAEYRAPQAEQAQNAGLIIEQDQGMAFDPHGAKYAPVM